jgi:hypothetical protein
MRTQDSAILAEELRRFLSISATTDKMTPMFSEYIDDYWHNLINEGTYEKFCDANGVEPLGHKENKGFGEIWWISEYEKRYGKLSELWFTRSDGSVDTELYSTYNKVGLIKACWDCHPMRENLIVPPADKKPGKPPATEKPERRDERRKSDDEQPKH